MPQSTGLATREDLAALESHIIEAIRTSLHETETRFVRAFFLCQEHTGIKFGKLTADVPNIDTAAELRLTNLESRVVEIEKRNLLGSNQ